MVIAYSHQSWEVSRENIFGWLIVRHVPLKVPLSFVPSYSSSRWEELHFDLKKAKMFDLKVCRVGMTGTASATRCILSRHFGRVNCGGMEREKENAKWGGAGRDCWGVWGRSTDDGSVFDARFIRRTCYVQNSMQISKMHYLPCCCALSPAHEKFDVMNRVRTKLQETQLVWNI